MDLFGGARNWAAADWTASDDRVRGGASQSYLSLSSDNSSARFNGNLDVTTLGGAGFASQRTTRKEGAWDLSKYEAIAVDIGPNDGKKYTLIIKDEKLDKDAQNGREQATISYEFDFEPKQDGDHLIVPWVELKPTYRGRSKPDAPPLKVAEVRGFSIMMRSFFGTQSGEFSLVLRAIRAANIQRPSSFPAGTSQDVMYS